VCVNCESVGTHAHPRVLAIYSNIYYLYSTRYSI